MPICPQVLAWAVHVKSLQIINHKSCHDSSGSLSLHLLLWLKISEGCCFAWIQLIRDKEAILFFIELICLNMSVKKKTNDKNKLFRCLKTTFERYLVSPLHDSSCVPDWHRAAHTSHINWLSLTSNARLSALQLPLTPTPPPPPPPTPSLLSRG